MIAPRNSLALAFLAALLAAPLAARADSLRCDGGIVSLGDWKLDLLGKCGQPTSREQLHAAPRVFGLQDGPPVLVTQETWTYDFGPGAFVQRVTLEIKLYDRDRERLMEAPEPVPPPTAAARWRDDAARQGRRRR